MEEGEEEMNMLFEQSHLNHFIISHIWVNKIIFMEIYNSTTGCRIEPRVNTRLHKSLELFLQASVSLLSCCEPDPLLLGQRYHCLVTFANNEYICQSCCKGMAKGILNVDDIK